MESEKDIYWVGSSYDDILGFPAEPKREAGFQLGKVQAGLDLGCRNLSFFDKKSALVFGFSQFTDKVKFPRSWFDKLTTNGTICPCPARMLRLHHDNLPYF